MKFYNYLKLLIITILILTGTSSLKAQNIDVGARIGGQWANASGWDTLSTTSKFNFTFSFFALIDAGPVVINPEVLFEGRGFKYDDDLGLFNLKQKIGYVTVPVFVNYYFMEDQLFIQAGPYASFLASADLNIEGSLGALGGDNQDSFNGIDYGLGFGAGVNVGRFDFGFRYMLGLADITEDGPNVSYDNTTVNHRVINFHVGVKILKNRGE